MGMKLERARQQRGLSKRAAAHLAGLSEVTWRQLESGKKQVAPSVVVEVSPRDDTLVAAAMAVGIDPAVVLAAAGRNYEPSEDEDPEPDPELSFLSGAWPEFSDEQRRALIEVAKQFRRRT